MNEGPWVLGQKLMGSRMQAYLDKMKETVSSLYKTPYISKQNKLLFSEL